VVQRPKLSYTLGANTLTKLACKKIMATSSSWATAKLGFARSMASSIRHGLFALGGAQLKDLWTEQGLARLILLLLHLRCPHEPNASMLISLSHSS